MKHLTKIGLALAGLLALAACSNDFEEIETLDLSRCLTPQNLNAKVSSSLGDVVTFSWDISTDAEAYVLEIYTDASLSSPYTTKTLSPSEVPYTLKMEADASFWFRVQATNSTKTSSNWADYGKSIKTYAVKDNLYLKVASRTEESIGVQWSTEISDFEDVDRLEYGLPGADKMSSYPLSASDISTGTATISGLTAGTQYVITLYYKSASRGEVNAWTAPSTTGFTEVGSLEGLLSAVLTPGAKILLKMDGSPYDIEALDIGNGFTLVGEETVDGTKPVVQGEFHISDAWTSGADLYFESIDFNGAPTAASPSGFGFALQNKNGGTVKDKNIGNVTYKNCVIRNFTKGLIYEWGNNMIFGDFLYDSCEIHDLNPDGTVGGDCFDIRQATTFASVKFLNNTIYQGMRTFLRFDAGSIGEFAVENNTVQNLNFVDNTNNAGFFGLQIVPGSFSFRNNLFLNFTGKATLESANVKYKSASDMAVSASENYFYNLPVGDDGALSYFTDNFTLGQAGGTILDSDPCYNSPGGYFNILSDAAIAGRQVGASKWWTAYVEEPEDLTLPLIAGSKTWDLSNAKYFSGTMKKEMVRDYLYINSSESNPIVAADGMLTFNEATVKTRSGIPSIGYLAFKVDKPGSVLVKPADPDGEANHIVVGVGPVDGSSVTVKGGASAMTDMTNPQKILISTISEESLVYIWASGKVGLSQLAWSTDVSPVNTALPAPEPVVTPDSYTAGEAVDLVVSWDPVDNAQSYSVVFSGKTYAVEECEYIIGSTTTAMLDPGSYTVKVYANPGDSDIYNTESEAGTAAFAVLPKADSGSDDTFIVKNSDELLAAIAAGKQAITLAPGSYDLGGQLTITDPLSLVGQSDAVVSGAFKLAGEVGSFSLDNLVMAADGQGNFIEFDAAEGVKASEVTVRNTVIDGYSKSVIYASNTADMFFVDNITFHGVEVYNHGTGQGMFDLRNGTYQGLTIEESTLTEGRDWLRVDATCTIYSVLVKNNTMYNLNTSKNGNGIFYVRANVSSYRVEKNLLLGMTSGTVIGKSGAKVPTMVRNYFYDCNDDVFFTGIMDKEAATAYQGAVLSVDPVKDSANKDFTLVNGVVMSAGVGASKWNPSVVPEDSSDAVTVTTADEFTAAIEAGKTSIKFAAGSYDLSAGAITLTPGMRLTSTEGAEVKVSQIELAEGELGTLLIEGLTIVGDDNNNLINVANASSVTSLTVRNCDISHIKKSVFYGNAEASFTSVVFSNCMLTELGGGQGTFDIRKGTIVNLSIENCTIVGGRDFIRADAGHVTGAVTVANNTFDGVTLNNGNGILYVRSTPETYIFRNNLFLNENGDNCRLSKDAGVTVPTTVRGNFFYNCTADAFWTGLVNQEVALANGGVILTSNPVKDSANGDYTLTDALCLSSNVGAARWNPNAGTVTSDITVSSVAELATSIDAGKATITLRSGTYDLGEVADGGVITLIAPLNLVGSGYVEIVGGFKFAEGTTSFTAQNITFNGLDKTLGNCFEVLDNVALGKFQVKDCEIVGFNKSLFYGNGTDSRVDVFDFEKNLVHGFGTGQGMIDIRKGVYGAVNVSKNTFYDGGRDFIRCDKEIASSIAITNNTFGACSVDAGNGLLWIRSCASNPENYTVARNLFLNITGSSILAKSGATVPQMSSNFYFNVAEGFFSGAIAQDVAVGGEGGIVDADPCKASAEFDFTLANEVLRSADVGDPRWNSASKDYSRKKK